MLFTLEAVFAKQGDALIVHYGSVDAPHALLVDGGPAGVYDEFLRPRLQLLRDERGLADEESLPLELVMVTHSDGDHIVGVLDLFHEELDAHEGMRSLPYTIKRLWHNSYDDVIGGDGPRVAEAVAASLSDPAHTAVVASVADARRLRKMSEKLAVGVVNRGRDVIAAHGTQDDIVDLGSGLLLRLLCPDQKRIDGYRELWRRELPAILRKEKKAAELAAMVDNSPSNLASLVVHATMGGRSILLTGDARGDDILAGLTSARLLSASGGAFRVDLLKMPHHGSSRNVDEDFFRRIVADHYVFSGNGQHDNPDAETLRMIAAARGTEEYNLHFTVTRDADQEETNPKRRDALTRLLAWVDEERPTTCHVFFRDPDRTPAAIHVDLGDEPLTIAG